MVEKEIIYNIITKSIETKCHDYPKAVALREFEQNKSQYQTETYEYGTYTRTLPSPVGMLQSIQAEAQSKIEYESLEKGVARDYSTNSYIPLNMMLNNVTDWEKRCRFMGYDFGNGFVMAVLDFDKEEDPNYEGSPWVDLSMPQESQILSGMIDKSPRVLRDSIVYRYGELPKDIPIGGHGRFKGFQSTSYNPFVAFEDIPEGGAWVQGEKDRRYKMTMYVPTGTKGMVLNRHNGCSDWQSELLLDKGQRYIVLNRNDKEMTADILIY